MTDSTLAIADARYGELLRLRFMLDDPAFDMARLRAYVEERTEEVYPVEFRTYRRRWEQLAAGRVEGSAQWVKLEYMEWRRVVDALVEELRLAELLGEGETAQAREYRAVLMLDQGEEDA